LSRFARLRNAISTWRRHHTEKETEMAKSSAPEKAVILAAGFGTRLRPLTDLRPKPLVEVNGVSILHNALCNLEAVGVKDVTIVVGYRKDAIQYACGRQFGGLEINYVESTLFDKTGSAYSLWLAREALLRGDAYLLEGDVFFEDDALRRLRDDATDNAADVAPFDERMEGSAVILGPDGIISEVRMKQTAANLNVNGGPKLFKTMNLLRFSGQTLREMIVPVLDGLIGSGAVKSYTEELLAHLIERKGLKLGATRCDDLKWYEIDSEDDLRIAEAIFAYNASPAQHQRVRVAGGTR
jgi:NDP-sugar pyrophosphorylase family protein